MSVSYRPAPPEVCERFEVHTDPAELGAAADRYVVEHDSSRVFVVAPTYQHLRAVSYLGQGSGIAWVGRSQIRYVTPDQGPRALAGLYVDRVFWLLVLPNGPWGRPPVRPYRRPPRWIRQAEHATAVREARAVREFSLECEQRLELTLLRDRRRP